MAMDYFFQVSLSYSDDVIFMNIHIYLISKVMMNLVRRLLLKKWQHCPILLRDSKFLLVFFRFWFSFVREKIDKIPDIKRYIRDSLSVSVSYNDQFVA
jgi:hypothetical protein